MDIQHAMNRYEQTNKVFGDLTGAFTDLIDLGEKQIYHTLTFENGFNTPVIVTIGGNPNEFIIPANQTVVMGYPFLHNGVIQWKHDGTAPITGTFMTFSI